MDEHNKPLVPDEIAAVYAAEAVLNTADVAGLCAIPNKSLLGKDKDFPKGIRVSEDKDGKVLDIYLDVYFGANIPEVAWNVQDNVKKSLTNLIDINLSRVNIHVQGVQSLKKESRI